MNKYKQPTIEEVKEPEIIQPMYLNNLIGSLEVVSAVPTGKPTKFIDQFKFYSNGSTYRLYVYNSASDVWRYTSLT